VQGLVTGFLLSLVLTARAADADRPESTGYILPRAAYDPDEGPDGGAQWEYARLSQDREPYAWAVMVGAYVSVFGQAF